MDSVLNHQNIDSVGFYLIYLEDKFNFEEMKTKILKMICKYIKWIIPNNINFHSLGVKCINCHIP